MEKFCMMMFPSWFFLFILLWIITRWMKARTIYYELTQPVTGKKEHADAEDDFEATTFNVETHCTFFQTTFECFNVIFDE